MLNMNTEIIVALIALVSTLAGSFCGGLASSNMTRYRLKKLEEKVDKHNSVLERMTVAEEHIKVADHRISDLEALCRR